MDDNSGMKVFALTDRGNLRKSNEDCVYASAEDGLLIAADGMGGHAGGEVASALAVRIISQMLRGSLPHAAGLLETWAPHLLRHAVRQADAAIHARAGSDPALAGMGTTVVLALCRRDAIAVAHAGDSRAYLLRDGKLAQITRDHSLVRQMVDTGAITADEARKHNLRNVVTQCLGGQEHAEADVRLLAWKPGDILLLCTDGLTNMVEDREIEQVLRDGGADLESSARKLVQMANESGGIDNISVVVGCLEETAA